MARVIRKKEWSPFLWLSRSLSSSDLKEPPFRNAFYKVTSLNHRWKLSCKQTTVVSHFMTEVQTSQHKNERTTVLGHILTVDWACCYRLFETIVKYGKRHMSVLLSVIWDHLQVRQAPQWPPQWPPCTPKWASPATTGVAALQPTVTVSGGAPHSHGLHGHWSKDAYYSQVLSDMGCADVRAKTKSVPKECYVC